MTEEDARGCPMTTEDQAVIAPWTATVRAFLAHSAETPVHLGAVFAADPGLVMAHVCKGLFSLLLGRRELVAVAEAAAGQARASMAERGATARERLYLEALSHWLGGRPSLSVVALEQVLLADPMDALAMKLSQAIRFMLGDQAGMRRSVERLMPLWPADHPELGYLHGCHAFTLEEAGDYAEAEARGRRGLELAPDDAWGLHAIAHIHDMTGQSADGIRFLTANRSAWAHCNNFRYHVWWHLALMYLDRGEPERALDLYDGEIRRDRTDDYRDIANATSLLIRLELEGVNVGDRWEELAGLCAGRTEDGCLVFADLHYMLALCAGNRGAEADELVRRLRRDALAGESDHALVARNPGVAVAEGLRAFREGSYAMAYVHLASARRGVPAIGGSEAQRDVFERLTIEAAIRSGHLARARGLIGERTARRGAADGFGRSRAELVEDILAREHPPRAARAGSGLA